MFGNSRDGSGTPFIGVIPLRLGAGITLLYMHAWNEAVSAWQYLWNQVPWGSVDMLRNAGLPLPQVLAVASAALAAFTGVSWILGFAVRFASLLFIPVSLGALLVANRTGQSFAAEASVLFFFISVTLLASGAGWLSLDALGAASRKRSGGGRGSYR